MKRASYLSLPAIAILLMTGVTGSIVAAGQWKNPHNERGGLFTHGDSKGAENKTVQWSADPEQGWVRSRESHSMQERQKSLTSPKSTGGKNKENGKARKRF